MSLHPALSDPSSAQVMYRPVLQLARLPPYPRAGATDRESRQAMAWWREQMRRCRQGWVAPDGTWLNPILYFALNFCKCAVQQLDGKGTVIAPPFFRQTMKDRLDDIWMARAEVTQMPDGTFRRRSATGIIEAKGRRAAWTTDTLEFVGLWSMVHEGDRPIGCLYPDGDNMPKEREALRKAYNRLPLPFRLRRTEQHGVQALKWVVDNKDILTLGYVPPEAPKLKGRRRRVKPTKPTALPGEKAQRFVEVNSCRFELATINPGPFKGHEFNLVMIVEAGKFRAGQLSRVWADQKDCIEREGFRFGQFLIGGTSDLVSNEATDYRDMCDHAASFGLRRRFCSAVLVQGFDLWTGQSTTEENLKKLMKRRADARATGKASALTKEKQNNPIYYHECFIPEGGSPYDRESLEAHYQELLREGAAQKEWVRGKMDWERDIDGQYTGRVAFRADAQQHVELSDTDVKGSDWGKFLLHRDHLTPHTHLDGAYFGAYDDVFKDLAPTSDSLACGGVWYKGTYLEDEDGDMPVCLYLDRTTVAGHNEDILKMAVFFDCQVLSEMHNEQFRTFLSGERATKVTGRSQEDRVYWVGRQPGIDVKGEQIVEMTRDMEEFITGGGLPRLRLPRLVAALLRWRQGNDDVASMLHILVAMRARMRAQAIRRREREPSGPGVSPRDIRAGITGGAYRSAAGGTGRGALDKRGIRDRVMGRSR